MLGEKSTRNYRFAALVLLFLLPLVLRLLPIGHGAERIYVPDNSMVRAALGMARDHDLIPPVSSAQPYGNLMPYLLLPLYGVQYVVGRMSGAWHGVKEFGAHLLEHPAHAAWIARALVAVFGALTAWIVFRAARAAGLKQGAWVAAWLVGTGLLSVQMSTQERPWVPQVCFMAAAVWAAIVYVNAPRARTLVVAGVMAGLACATHQGGLGALLIPGLAWAFAPGGWKGSALRARLASGFATVFAFALVALVFGHLYLLRYGWIPTKQVVGGEQIDEHSNVTLGGMVFIFETSFASVARLARAVVGYDPVVVCLGLCGLVLALRVRSLRVPVIFALVWALLMMTNRSDHVRYLLPVTTLLALPAGVLVERLWQVQRARAYVVLLLAFPLVQATRFDWLLMREDTRAIAEQRLGELPAQALVVIDRYGPEVDLDRSAIYGLEKLRNSRRMPLRAREEARKQELDRGSAERAGVNAIHLEEVFGYDDRTRAAVVFPELVALGKTPREVFANLGATHYLRVDRRLANDDYDFMFGAQLPGRSVWVVSPNEKSEAPREAFLPLEMEFPLTALWIVDRPGPWLELRALD
jgi:hypothetical protein